MTQDDGPLATLARIDEAQATLMRLVRSAERARLMERPASGAWSAMENVRHLLFAEQAHLGRFLADVPWSALGLAPRNVAGQRRLSAVGSEPTASIDEVLGAWRSAHQSVRAAAVAGRDGLNDALKGNLRHLSAHIEAIERLLRT